MVSNPGQPIQKTKQPDTVRATNGGVNPAQTSMPTIAQVAFQSHIGPLPSAAELADYNKIKPDLVERILCMAEANAASERTQAENEQKNYYRLNYLGRILGFAFALSALFATVWLSLHNHDKVAAAIGIAAVGGTVIALISGKSNKSAPHK